MSLYAAAMVGIIWGVWSSSTGVLNRLLSLRLLTYLGKMTFGFYLIHMFTFALVENLYQAYPVTRGVPLFWATLGCALILGMLMWHLVERPINNLKRYFPYRHEAEEGKYSRHL